MRHRRGAAPCEEKASAVDAERSAEKKRIRMIESVPFLLHIRLPFLIQIRIRNDRRLAVHLVDPVLMLHQEMKMQRAHFLGKYRILRRRENDRLARSRLLALLPVPKGRCRGEASAFPCRYKTYTVPRRPFHSDRSTCTGRRSTGACAIRLPFLIFSVM